MNSHFFVTTITLYEKEKSNLVVFPIITGTLRRTLGEAERLRSRPGADLEGDYRLGGEAEGRSPDSGHRAVSDRPRL